MELIFKKYTEINNSIGLIEKEIEVARLVDDDIKAKKRTKELRATLSDLVFERDELLIKVDMTAEMFFERYNNLVKQIGYDYKAKHGALQQELATILLEHKAKEQQLNKECSEALNENKLSEVLEFVTSNTTKKRWQNFSIEGHSLDIDKLHHTSRKVIYNGN